MNENLKTFFWKWENRNNVDVPEHEKWITMKDVEALVDEYKQLADKNE